MHPDLSRGRAVAPPLVGERSGRVGLWFRSICIVAVSVFGATNVQADRNDLVPLASVGDPASEPAYAEQFGDASPVAFAETTMPQRLEDLRRADSTKLDEVEWRIDAALSLGHLSQFWNIPLRRLVELNPSTPPRERLPVGSAVVVYRRDLAKPPRSVGAPNRGRLRGGVPMPEGRSWHLRRSRRRIYGTARTISVLVGAFEAYGERFPDAPRVRIGDISARRGGRISPHRSHQSGRDVDLGFVLREHDGVARRRVTKQTFDPQKNWFLVRALIDTGKVQTIFISEKVQRWLRPVAERDLGPVETARYFALIKHAKGHRGHMHVRLRCADEERHCVAESIKTPIPTIARSSTPSLADSLAAREDRQRVLADPDAGQRVLRT